MDIYSKLRIVLYSCEAIATIAGFMSWKKISSNYWRWFPIYLLLIVTTEVVTEGVFNITGSYKVNIAIHDFFAIPLQFFFFIWLFYAEFKDNNSRRWPLIGAVIYLACWIVDLLYFRNEKLWFVSFSYLVGNIILLALVIRYFINLVSGDNILRFSSFIMFWVAWGVLIFYLGSFPFFGMYNTLAVKYPELFNDYWKIATVLGCVMYLIFAFAFLWKKPK